MSRTRVVISGIGLVLPPGVDASGAAARALAGDSGIGRLTRFDPGVSRSAAEVPPIALGAVLRKPKNEKFAAPPVALGMRAAIEAMRSSAFDGAAVDPLRFGLYAGSGQTGLEPSEFFRAMEIADSGSPEGDYKALGGRAARRIDPHWSLRTLSNAGLGLLAAEFDARGPCGNFVQGDTASAHAIAAGYFDLLEDRCDVVLAGGYDSLLTPSTYLAYDRAGLLAGHTCRPFDRDRDGLVLGEGAAFVVLEREADAVRRGARPIAELIGVGAAQSVTHEPSATMSADALREALVDAAGTTAPQAIVARGIGTREDDRSEAAALVGAGLSRVPVTAFKGLTGYLGAATGAVELGLIVLALREQGLPPIAGLQAPEDSCALDLAMHPRRLPVDDPVALCLTWSWSGGCAAIAVRVPAA